jgi:hypothetical protein
MDTHAEGSNSSRKEDEAFCPLFTEGLPTDFTTNPTLAAIASLLQEEEDDKGKEKDDRDNSSTTPEVEIAARPGGGKLSRSKGRHRNRLKTSPYASAVTKPQPKKPPSSESASLGEAQLFLKMWKL